MDGEGAVTLKETVFIRMDWQAFADLNNQRQIKKPSQLEDVVSFQDLLQIIAYCIQDLFSVKTSV